MTVLVDQIAEMKAELAKLRAENEALAKAGTGAIRLKVSEKGAVSLYGMGRWPVTLYKTQWYKIEEMMPTIKAFIKENERLLKVKGE